MKTLLQLKKNNTWMSFLGELIMKGLDCIIKFVLRNMMNIFLK